MTTEQRTTPEPLTERPASAVSRRDLLRGLAAGAVASGAALTTRQGSAQTPATPVAAATPATPPPTPAAEVDVTLLSSGYPWGPMPTAEDQQANPAAAGYAEALQSWLDLNPGVRIEASNVDQWNQEALTTAAVGGTAPAWFNGAVLGGYNPVATFSAFQQGLAKDVTDLVQSYGIDGKVADYVTPTWEAWKLDGRAFGSPDTLIPGNGIFFRRDLILEAGLPEPAPGWTWEDFRTIASALTQGERRGAAMQGWGIGWALGADGYELLTRLPAPDDPWHWRADYTSRAETWANQIQFYRDMVFTDGSILSDITFGDGECGDAFARGDVGMYPSHAGFYTAEPASSRSIIALADKLGQTIEETAGWTIHPIGATGVPTNTQAILAIVSFSPDLEGDAIDKAFNLYDYMTFGPGFTIRRQVAYERTKDLRLVFGDVAPVNGVTEIPGVPGTPTDAWGPKYIEATQAALAVPIAPNESRYFPAEQNPGPTSTAGSDAISRWAYEPGQLDLTADLQQLEETLNSQFQGFESSVSRDDFVAGARAYYDAHRAYWEEHSPEFFTNTFTPWYEENVAPVLEG